MSTTSPQVLETSPISGTIGAVVDASELRPPFDEAAIEALHQAVALHGVVILRGMQIDDTGHLALARQLGEIRVPPVTSPTWVSRACPRSGCSSHQGWARTPTCGTPT